MDNDEKLAEYVLSQDGIIFRGTYKHPVPTPWNFGQVPTPTETIPLHPVCRQLGRIVVTLGSDNGERCPFIKWYNSALRNRKNTIVPEYMTLESADMRK